MKLENIINKNLTIDLEMLKTDEELVRQIQTELSELLLYPASEIDGLYGDRTQAALIEFCQQVHLNNMQTGKFGKSFAEKLIIANRPDTNKFLSSADYQQAANFLGVEVALIRALVEVESAGQGFLADGRPKILFERHIFFDETNGAFAATHPSICNSRPGGYLGNEREWPRLEAALQLNRKAALRSASWGLGQIMGFNHKVVGYTDIEAFVQAMHQSEGKHLEAMMTFLKANNLVSALRNHDWTTIARFYNGPAGPGVYDRKLAAAYARYA